MFDRNRSVRSDGSKETAQVVLGEALIARANSARDAKRHLDAAILYSEALRLDPGNGAIYVQCGHMFKEAGAFDRAETQYNAALQLLPDDADLALQLGHFYKMIGRPAQSAESYLRAQSLKQDWAEPAAELAALQGQGWCGSDERAASADEADASRTLDFDRRFEDAADLLRLWASSDRLVPEIVPRKPNQMAQHHRESIALKRFGQRERSPWGMIPTLRGVEAIRGFCISKTPIVELQILLNGMLIHRGPVRGGYVLQYEREKNRILKYVFNVWLDFSVFSRGRHDIELRFLDADQNTRSRHEHVAIAASLTETDHPDSDAVITLPATDKRSVLAQINARPSVVRPPARVPFQRPIRNVLVLRTDQLGDLVTSLPAMRRLRELLPEARLVGALTHSNVDFARTLGVFDEIIEVHFPDDMLDRLRIMPLAEQEILRRTFDDYRFDLALDLAESSMSRPLLLLSGAPFLYGFYDRDWPWLTGSFEGNTRDVKNRLEIAPHSTRVLAFVERLGAMLRSRAEITRRPDLAREQLGRHGINPEDRFAVLHTGARIVFSRWPYYADLAALILQHTDLKVFLMIDDPTILPELPNEITQNLRFHAFDSRLPFDDFDALLSFCQVFVGNDSGPKHLASLRGANVVSIHSARVNWNEWGQEMTGCIISRKVPCAGCQLYHDADECGQDYACIVRITPEEVFEAVRNFV